MSDAVVERLGTGSQNTVQERDRGRTTILGRLCGLVAGRIPALLVFAALGGLFYFGQHYEWRMPKFSTLVGATAPRQAAWCMEHGVPEAECVVCHPELLPRGPDYGWCAEHGVHNCVLDHPDVAQLQETPDVSEADRGRAARALALGERTPNNAACKNYQKRIQFASVKAVEQAGVEVALVGRQPIGEWVAANGEITYDPTRLARLSSRAPGTVWRVEKNIGDPVRAGEVLALVNAVAVGKAKTRLMQALAEEKLQRQNVARLKKARGAVADRLIIQSEAALSKAQAAVISAEQSLANLGLHADVGQLRELSNREVMDELRFLGIPKEVRSQLATRTMTANLLPIRSPMEGVIVERNVVVGEVVASSDVLFQVADTSRMWLILNVPLADVPRLSLGQTVRFRPAGGEMTVTGRLDWISTAANQKTRMVKARVELPNPDGTLRNETFGSGRIILREEAHAIVVPKDAVHWEGCCHVVFVRNKGYFDSPESPKVFHVRSVRVGVTHDGSSEIIAGVLPGEVVATGGSDVLRAQLLSTGLGAGCCGAE